MKYIFFITCIAFFFVSCGNTEKQLVKNDATWNIDKAVFTTEIPGFPTLVDESINLGTVTFHEDGTGIINYSNGTEENFEWMVEDDEITIEYFVRGFIMTYDILESSSKEQSWKGTIQFTLGSDPTTYTEEIELTAL